MKVKPTNYVTVDIGTTKIAALAANISKIGEITVIAQVLQSSAGFRGGEIVDLKAAESSIIAAIYDLEKKCERNINEITVSLSLNTKSYYISQTLKLGAQQINKQDIKKLIQKALSDFLVKDQEIIHYFPVEFTLDKENIIENPISMYARELSCQLHVITANSLVIKNLTHCFAKCHVQIGDFVHGIYASGLACLSEDEQETGAIIIDFGGYGTSIGVFLYGKMIYAAKVPQGGYHITLDIAKALSVTTATAEKLKILHGDARSDLHNKNGSIMLNDFEPDNDYNIDLSIPSSRLTEIIRPKAQEILTLLKKEYDRVSMDHLLAKRIVLTGGSSELPGLKNLAAEIFQKQVRTPKFETVTGVTENLNLSVWSTALGMLKLKALKYKKNSFKPGELDELGWLQKILLWFKENI